MYQIVSNGLESPRKSLQLNLCGTQPTYEDFLEASNPCRLAAWKDQSRARLMQLQP